MDEESGAPPPRNAEQHPLAEEASQPNSTPQKKDLLETPTVDELGNARKGNWSRNAVRHLSPSPSPNGRLSPIPGGSYNQGDGQEPQEEHPVRQTSLQKFWAKNKGPVLVAVSQGFGALMNLSARLLETEGDGMHPVQVLLLRQSITSMCCLIYMWWMETPGAPFGGKEIRLLLLVRGVAGFFGIYGCVKLRVILHSACN